MAAILSDEFKRDAAHIALTSGLTRRQVASDLGIGLSTLGKWVGAVLNRAMFAGGSIAGKRASSMAPEARGMPPAPCSIAETAKTGGSNS